MTESGRRRRNGGSGSPTNNASTSGGGGVQMANGTPAAPEPAAGSSAAPDPPTIGASSAPDPEHLAEEPPGLCSRLFFRRSNRVADSYQATGMAESGTGTASTAPSASAPPQASAAPAPPALNDDKFIIDMSSNLFYWWIFTVTMAFTYNLIFNIARYVFTDLYSGWTWAIWMIFDVLSDVIYILDILVRMRTGFLEQGLLVRDSKRIVQLYLKDWQFRTDILSILPFDYVMFAILWRPFPFGRALRLLRINRVNDCLERTETRSAYPNGFRVCCVIMYIVIIIHWNACFYFLLSETIGLGSDTWVYGVQNKQSLPDGIEDTLVRRYVYSFYWSTLTLTTIGEVPGPVRNIEFLFVTTDLMCGVLIFATIVGNVGSMISNMSAARAEFQNKMDGVKQYMALRKVSPQLENRVIKWFDYLWSNKQSLNDESVLKVLPDKLQAEIAMAVHFETLRKVRIFQDCESGLLAELVLKLHLQVFSPGDFICRKGDIGREMYIVKRGKLHVVSGEEEDAKVFATLQEGSVFGELSILNIAGSKNGNRRTANVKSVGYTDLFVLDKNALWNALKEYPEARKLLLAKGRELLKKDGLLDEDAPQEQATPEEIVDDLLQSINILQTRLARLIAEKTNTETKLTERIGFLERQLSRYQRRKARVADTQLSRSETLTADYNATQPFPEFDRDDQPGPSHAYLQPSDPTEKKNN